MGIRFTCPNGHRLHVKSFLAGRRGVCPKCGVSVLIPNAPEEAETGGPGNGNSAVGSGTAVHGPMVPGRSASSTDAASQSVIIAVTESATISEGAQAAPRIAPNVAEVVPPPVPSEPTVPPISSPRIDEAATSPAVRYVARRERNRRNQLVLAVVLLMSVIVLAIILILVLQRGFGTSTAYVVSSLRIVTCERSSKPPAEPGADGVRRSNDLLRG